MYYFLINDGTDDNFHKLQFKSLRAAKVWLGRGDKDSKRHLVIHEIVDSGGSKCLSFRPVNSRQWVDIELYKGEFKDRFINSQKVKS